MNEEKDVTLHAYQIIMATLRGSCPRYSQVVNFVDNYNGDGKSLEYAVALTLEIEEMWDELIEGLERGFEEGMRD